MRGTLFELKFWSGKELRRFFVRANSPEEALDEVKNRVSTDIRLISIKAIGVDKSDTRGIDKKARE